MGTDKEVFGFEEVILCDCCEDEAGDYTDINALTM